MRILVLGAGGVGGYFGGRLAAAGVDVRFLVRPARAQTLAEHGLVITSPLGNLRLPVHTLTQASEPVDAVLLTCKAYDLEAAIGSISPAVGAATLVLPLLNGLRHLDALDARFGPQRVLGGLCQIGATVNAAGEIEHLNTLQDLVLGARAQGQTAAATALHKELERGGFAPKLSADIVQEMWEKFTFLTAYAGMTTLMRAPIGAIVATQEGEAIAREMLAECAATASANGHTPRPAALARMLASITERGSAGTASMLRDMQRHGPTEHEHILGDMLARSRAARVPAPLLRVGLAHMQAYEAVRASRHSNSR